MNKPASKLVTAALCLGLIAAPIANLNTAYAAGDSTLKLSILETTDIHTNLMSYDYYKDGAAPTAGLSRTASLVKAVRAATPNTFLVDNGDLIQGTPLGTYKAKVAPLATNEIHPVYKAMNLMGYDAATLGNHEFNYGLDFLDQEVKGANFPYITKFDPQGQVTRAEFATMLVKALKLTAEETTVPYKDVASGSWYAGAIAAAYENGLIKGVSADRFAPTRNISREQMAVMAENALKALDKDAAASKSAQFADNDAISAWAKAGIDLIADKGIMTGREQNKFAPKATSNRAEAAKVVQLLLDSATK